MKALFLRKLNSKLKNYLMEELKEEQIDLVFCEDRSDKELIEEANDADVLIGWRPSFDLLQAASKAIALINPGVGVKRHIEPFRKLNAERETPLLLINGHGNSYFTAEHAVALLLSLMNKIVPYHQDMVQGKWRETSHGSSSPLKNRIIGLLGYGAINTKVHSFLSGFDVKFAALKRSWDEDLPDLDQYTPDQLHRFLEITDILIVALPHTSATEGIIGEEELSLLGRNGVVINVGRGILIDEDALYYALQNKVIMGAGIDVWYEYSPKENEMGEKFPFSLPFHKLDNIVMSPHRAASPFEDLSRWDEQIENLKRMAAGRRDFLNIVDLDREY